VTTQGRQEPTSSRSLLLAAAITALLPFPGLAADEAALSCLDSTLNFDTSALERLVNEPELVLEQEETFWSEEPAQEYTEVWARNAGFSIDRRKWRRQVSSFAQLSAGERADSPLMRTTEALLLARESFLADALPHVCAFLPEGTDTGVPVYLTAFIPPRAMVTGGIVINVDAAYWNGNAGNILNTLTHEIWHVGYSRLRNERTETPLSNGQLYGMLDQLQNEGTATYVGYRARARFPAPDEKDFDALDSPEAVTRALDEVNALLALVGTISEERLGKRSWRVGVEERAYYIAGAHMAAIIDGESGREALLATVRGGPVSFVDNYNALVSEERRVHLPRDGDPAPRGPWTYSRMVAILIAVVLLGVIAAVVVLRRMLS
jgi:hypothetical protein